MYGQKWAKLHIKPVGAVQNTDIKRYTPNIPIRKEMVKLLNTVPFLAFHLRGGQKYSHAGTRTRVYWVKANYPNHLDYMGKG